MITRDSSCIISRIDFAEDPHTRLTAATVFGSRSNLLSHIIHNNSLVCHIDIHPLPTHCCYYCYLLDTITLWTSITLPGLLVAPTRGTRHKTYRSQTTEYFVWLLVTPSCYAVAHIQVNVLIDWWGAEQQPNEGEGEWCWRRTKHRHGISLNRVLA